MDPAAIPTIAFAIILNFVVTVAALAVFYFFLKPRLDRRVDQKLAQAKRHAISQKRQTVAAIDKAVAGFNLQTGFLNDRCDKVVTECVRAVDTTRKEMVEDVRSVLSSLTLPKDPKVRRDLPLSVQAIRNRAEERMVAEINEDAVQPVGAK